MTDTGSIAKRPTAQPAVLSADEVQELATFLDRALPAYDRRT